MSRFRNDEDNNNNKTRPTKLVTGRSHFVSLYELLAGAFVCYDEENKYMIITITNCRRRHTNCGLSIDMIGSCELRKCFSSDFFSHLLFISMRYCFSKRASRVSCICKNMFFKGFAMTFFFILSHWIADRFLFIIIGIA